MHATCMRIMSSCACMDVVCRTRVACRRADQGEVTPGRNKGIGPDRTQCRLEAKPNSHV